MHHSPFRRRWTGGTAAVNGMEERDHVDASTNLCSQLWLLLAGDISVLARLMLTDCVSLSSYSTVAVTDRRHLRPRPVDFILLSSYSTVAVTGRRHLHPRPVDFVLLSSYSTVAVTGRRHLRPRPVDFVLLSSYLTLLNYCVIIFKLIYILWTNARCYLMAESQTE